MLAMDPWLSEVAIQGLGRQILNLKTRVRFPVALPYLIICMTTNNFLTYHPTFDNICDNKTGVIHASRYDIREGEAAGQMA